MLELRDLDLFYGDAQALASVSLDIGEGELVAIIGANGAGKSSLIRTIFGMQKPERGSIRFEGREISGEPPHLKTAVASRGGAGGFNGGLGPLSSCSGCPQSQLCLHRNGGRPRRYA